MSRSRPDAFVDRPDPIVLAADARHERPRRMEAAGPADGCDRSPWCRCWDCARVAGSHFPGLDAHNDLEDW
jgi:hypothetical protein